ncbi:uncharacterized protein LOC135466398 [Liolophura sinensis]|uniref:uncharacterized protein LOC135466398 n=1 Tax=Liolophura sinensis TaxID=3198878 RepID=UPI0031587BD2
MGFNVSVWAFVAILMSCCLEYATAQRKLISCYQCNVFSKGKQQFCEKAPEELIVKDCVACLKTFTFTSMHDRWSNQASPFHRYRQGMTYHSKYCLPELDLDLIKDEGCYKINGPDGFTERCYCHSELCNASSRMNSSVVVPVTVLVGVLWTALAHWF